MMRRTASSGATVFIHLKESWIDMWLVVLFLGLGVVGTAVLLTYLQWRKAKRLEHARLWQQHDDWLRKSRQDP